VKKELEDRRQQRWKGFPVKKRGKRGLLVIPGSYLRGLGNDMGGFGNRNLGTCRGRKGWIRGGEKFGVVGEEKKSKEKGKEGSKPKR